MSEQETPIEAELAGDPPETESPGAEVRPKRGRPSKARAAKIASVERARKFLELKIERRRKFANQEFIIQTPQGFRIEGASFEAVVELIALLGDRSTSS